MTTHTCPRCHSRSITTTTTMTPVTTPDGLHDYHIISAHITHQVCPCSLTQQDREAIHNEALFGEYELAFRDQY